MDNIFEKGVIVVLSISAWAGRRRVASNQIIDNDHRAEGDKVDPAAIGAFKRLVAGKALDKVKSASGNMRTYLYDKSLPFPLRGAVFVPTGMIPVIDAKLREYEAEFQAAVAEFVTEYPAAREEMRAKLGTLYSDLDYPPNIGDHFDVAWQYITLSPAGASQLVDPALIETERRKFQDQINAASAEFVAALRQRFAESIDHMVDRLVGPNDDGKQKMFRASTMGNLKEFLASFDAMNIADDAALKVLVDRAREVIADVDPVDLRKNQDIRSTVTAGFAQVQAALDGMMADRPSRKLRVLKSEPASEAA